jgi:hypothetical protein
MKFTASIIMALFSAASLVAANPTPADPVLEARGHGCPGSSNQCAFHVSFLILKTPCSANEALFAFMRQDLWLIRNSSAEMYDTIPIIATSLIVN